MGFLCSGEQSTVPSVCDYICCCDVVHRFGTHTKPEYFYIAFGNSQSIGIYHRHINDRICLFQPPDQVEMVCSFSYWKWEGIRAGSDPKCRLLYRSYRLGFGIPLSQRIEHPVPEFAPILPSSRFRG